MWINNLVWCKGLHIFITIKQHLVPFRCHLHVQNNLVSVIGLEDSQGVKLFTGWGAQAGIASRFLKSAKETFPCVVPTESSLGVEGNARDWEEMEGNGRKWKGVEGNWRQWKGEESSIYLWSFLKLLLEVPLLLRLPTEDRGCCSCHLSLTAPSSVGSMRPKKFCTSTLQIPSHFMWK